MNYKDKDDILLMICGGMGIAALTLIFRYLFIGLEFDSIGANIVFVIVFVVGLIFFISYLEFIQKIVYRFTKNKPEVNIELEDCLDADFFNTSSPYFYSRIREMQDIRIEMIMK